jgi:hypothetical protein
MTVAVGAPPTAPVPGIWFPFGIGVSRSQYIYAIVIPLLALLIVRTGGDYQDTAALLPT